METPLAHVPVPSGLHLTNEDDFLALHVNGDAEEVAGVLIGVEDRCGRGRTESEAGGDVAPVRLDHALLVLPVPVAAAAARLVQHVQDRDVSTVEHALTAVVDESKLYTRAVGAGGGSRSDREESP
jgi:hypothetical protein